MKKIEAIIRKSRFEEVKKALFEMEINFFTYWDVTGVGKEREDQVYRSVVSNSNIHRRVLSIVVRDHNAEKTIKAIMKSAWTGVVGDGKIFVYTIDEAYRIRTGESGPGSLFLQEEEKEVHVS